MTLAGYQIAYLEAFYVLSNLYNLSYILMTCSQTNGNRVLCPLIPVINMYVCSTDRRFVNFDLHIIFSHHRYRYFFHPETYVCFFFYQCPHHFTHYLFLQFFHLLPLRRKLAIVRTRKTILHFTNSLIAVFVRFAPFFI